MSEPGVGWAPRTSEQDQAAGLRRLLRPHRHRTVAVLASGAGLPGSTLTEGLALELAHRGREVVIISGVGQGGRGPRRAGGPASRRRHVRVVPLTVPEHRGTPVDPAKLARQLEALRQGGEIMLVEVPEDGLAVALAAQDLVLACGAQPVALMSSYRLLKRMVQAGGHARTQVLVCGAHSEAQAGRVFANLSDTARRFLALRLDYVGHLRDSAHLLEAARLQQPASAVYPESPCGALLARCIHAVLEPRADR